MKECEPKDLVLYDREGKRVFSIMESGAFFVADGYSVKFAGSAPAMPETEPDNGSFRWIMLLLLFYMMNSNGNSLDTLTDALNEIRSEKQKNDPRQ